MIMIERSSCGMKLFTANDQIDGYCLPDATMTIIHSINTGINGMDDGGGVRRRQRGICECLIRSCTSA